MSQSSLQKLTDEVGALLGDVVISSHIDVGELTIEVSRERITDVCRRLRDEAGFEQLTDLCGIDYSEYGACDGNTWQEERYAVVYHLLSYARNRRLRLRARVPESDPSIDSVIDIWPGANWFEREAFDLFGIIFHGHPDLRRLLTDYGFIGHPFRKDFPLSGQVEMRYDEEQGRVIYQPVTIEPRILVPRSVRKDAFGRRETDVPTEESA
jgi:NADH-quinone oxidoreductase subunit C